MTRAENILVTVLIPTRNRPQLLQRTLASVAQQNITRMEVCVVDNNPDEVFSAAVKQSIYEFERLYPHISWQYFHSPKPFAAGARNDGMKIAKGKYICLLDDDDELLDNSIETRVKHMMADPDLALLYCASISNIYPYPFEMYRYYHFKKRRHQEGLMMMSCSCIIINKHIFEYNDLLFDETLRRMEDYDLCRRLIKMNLKVKSIPQALVRINLHPDTRMSSNSLEYIDFKEILIRKWKHGIEEYLNSYIEGVFIWRNCFGIEKKSYTETCGLLSGYMKRKPSLAFKAKYLLISVSPVLFLGVYHFFITISQFYKNKVFN
ncbi:MAG: glycosyltransferase family 2 protein [Mucilaginibacter sp.]|nr:glycosyltransferase family 2 protein [Mucilaginibacter sp.]